jgi:hypothetical protein
MVVAGLSLGIFAASAASQVVYGFVVDPTTAERLVATSLVLLDTLGTPVGTGFAGTDGAFVVRAPRAGVYRLRARRLGYDDGLTELIDLRSEPSISFLVRLNPKPIELPSLTVEAKRVVARLQEAGFYERKKMGFGQFVTPEMIARRDLMSVTDLMRGMAGVRLLYRNGHPVDVILRAGDLLFDGRSCRPVVLVDGVALRAGRDTTALDDLVSVNDIAAAEVYPDVVGAPLQAGGLDGGCGAILLWTKRR